MNTPRISAFVTAFDAIRNIDNHGVCATFYSDIAEVVRYAGWSTDTDANGAHVMDSSYFSNEYFDAISDPRWQNDLATTLAFAISVRFEDEPLPTNEEELIAWRVAARLTR